VAQASPPTPTANGAADSCHLVRLELDMAGVLARVVALEAVRPFSFSALCALTPELSGDCRAAVFELLPQALREEAWTEAATFAHAASEMLWELETPVERPAKAKPRPRLVRAVTSAVRSGEDVLLEVSPATYVEALLGVDVPPSGMIRCPFTDHEDRTPSFKVYAESGWHCFGCGRGGTIYDLGAAVFGLSTRGRDFKELRVLLANSLLGRVAA